MRRVAIGMTIALVLALTLGGCQMAAGPAPTDSVPAPGETSTLAQPVAPTGETPPPEEATPAQGATPEGAVTPEEEATPAQGATSQAQPTPTEAGAETVAPTETPRAEAAPAIDGVVAEGDYANTTTIGDVQVWWANDGDSLTMAIEAPAEGWVGVGLDPDNGMQGADFKLAAVLDSETRVTDAWGAQPTGPGHPPDEELGGTDDIVESAVVTEDGATRFEFRVPLDSGDEYDKPLEPGNTYAIIVAYAGSDDYNAYHSARQAGEIVLDPAP